ncbi:restriction endonuclease subunit S [Campylobacter devanensis]|uniref:restriction endonuclease subunit S n=1 Tax=Campylobacter devanensis TaxID=3161138 RepID=UPI000A35366A|nr:restriction endonuclease subunit S [Campylobacter sp. P157]
MNRQIIFHGDKRQRLKFVCKKIFTGKTPVYDFENTEFLIIGQKNNQNGRIDISEPKYAKKEFYFSNSKDLFLQKGDIVLNSLGGGSVGRIGFFDLDRNDILTDGHPIIFRVNEHNNKKFIFYALLNEQSQLEFLANGSTNQCFLNISDVWNFEIPSPLLNEQKKIAEFLDKKCEIIDKRLSNLERKIKGLKEYKKSLISECVTKGLNPKNREFKDSGIPWIGQIPKHWEISKIKYHGTARNGLTYSPSDLTDESGILVLRSSNVQNSKLVFHDNVYVSCSVKNNLMVKNNDILICSRNGSRNLIGKNALIDIDIKATFGAFMLIYRSKISKFMFYVLNSNIFSYHLSNFVTSTINQLTNSNFENIKFPLPPLNEQKEIAEFLDKKCEKIDRLNENYTKQITALKEYKKSLIYECVTGKKEI